MDEQDAIQQDSIELDLGKIFQAIRDKLIVILLAGAVAACMCMSYAVAYVAPKYSATAMLYVNSSNDLMAGSKLSISTLDLNAAKSLVDTYIVILNSRTTLEQVLETSGFDDIYSYGQLAGMISASAVNRTEVLAVTVTCGDPYDAALLANTIVEILPYRIASIVEGSSVRIVDDAAVNTVRVSPNYSLYAVVGFVFGVTVTFFFYMVKALLDDKIQNSDAIAATYQLPVLAIIPDLASDGGSSHYYGNSKREHSRSRR